MNYNEKYHKYKTKYLNLLYGGDGDENKEIIMQYENAEIKAGKMPVEDVKDETNNIGGKIFKRTIAINNDVKTIIVKDIANRKITETILKNNILNKKSYYIYANNIIIELLLDNFEKDDNTNTVGKGKICIHTEYNDIINGKVQISKIKPGVRSINVELIDILFNNGNTIQFGTSINLNDAIKTILELVKKDKKLTVDTFINKCPELLEQKESIPLPLYRDIKNVVCRKLMYSIDIKLLKQFLEYSTLFKNVLELEFLKIINNVKINSEYYNSLINDIAKFLPSTIDNNNIMFLNNTKNFIPLPKQYDILFDSGNATVTTVGINIVKQLGLHIEQGCQITLTGIGGKTKCSGYVVLEFKLNEAYSEANNKSYKIIAFVSDEQKNSIIFGHNTALTHLFNDNYFIKNKYDNTHLYNLNLSIDEIVAKQKELNNTLKQLLKSSLPLEVIIKHLDEIFLNTKINMFDVIDIYDASYDKKELYANLKEMYSLLEKAYNNTGNNTIKSISLNMLKMLSPLVKN